MKNSIYFCDFCYTFLEAVRFEYFLLKLLPSIASKILLQPAILDISDCFVHVIIFVLLSIAEAIKGKYMYLFNG